MRSPRPPRPLFPPSDSDIALAEAGDRAARTRVRVQQSRMRKREREIQDWYRKNNALSPAVSPALSPAVSPALSPAVSDDDLSLHDDAVDNDAFANDISIDRYV